MKGFAVLLATVILAGCSGGVPSPPSPSVHGFTAVGPDGSTWTFSGPTEIRDHDGTNVAAYRFIQGPLTTWLDSGFRVVRNDLACADGPESCATYSETWWLQRGALNRAGLGFGWLAIQGHPIAEISLAGNMSVPYDRSTTDTEQTVTLQSSEGAKSFTYSGTELLPKGHSAYLRGTDLPAADWLAAPTPVAGQDWRLFPGQGLTQYGAPASHEQLLTELLNRSPQARVALDAGGCISEYELVPTTATTSAELLFARRGEARFSIGEGSGAPVLYTLAWDIGELDIPMYTVTSGDAPDTALACSSLDKSFMGTDSATFEQAAASLSLTSPDVFVRTYQQFGDTVRPMYLGFYTPPGIDKSSGIGSFRSYSLQMHADDGTLTYFLGQPGKI